MLYFKEFLLSEMRVHEISPPKRGNQQTVIAFRGDIWTFNSDNWHDQKVDLWPVMQKIVQQHPRFSRRLAQIDPKKLDFHEIWTWINQNVLDGFTGAYSPPNEEDYLIVYTDLSWHFSLSPNAPIFKKVCKTLGVRRYYLGGQEYKVEDQSEKVYWHGTTDRFLSSIQKYGLAPGLGESKYKNNPLVKSDQIKPYIYISDQLNMARNHANHAAIMLGGKPIVIKLTIPDPSKLVPDYDMDQWSEPEPETYRGKEVPKYKPHFYSHDDYESFRTIARSSVSPTRTMRITGVYGYHGRIPTSHILGIKPL